MSGPRDSVYLGHIQDSIARIESYTAGLSEADFLSTPIVQDAVIHQIQILGEAANRLSTSFQQRSSSIPWRDIIGMRHKLVHDYMGVDLGAVWQTVVRDLPALKAELDRLH